MSSLCELKSKQVKKDGIWSWVICICALLNNAIVQGIDASFGEIIGPLIRTLGSSASVVAWVPSIYTTNQSFFSWVSTIFTQKYGFRVVISVGVLVSFGAYLSAIWSENVIALLLTYGVIGGAGSGLLYTPGNIISSYYFEKHIDIATSIAICGGGIGIAFIEPLSNHINTKFGVNAVFASFSCFSLLSLFLAIMAFPVMDKKDVSTCNAIDSQCTTPKKSKTAVISVNQADSDKTEDVGSQTQKNVISKKDVRKFWNNALDRYSTLKDMSGQDKTQMEENQSQFHSLTCPSLTSLISNKDGKLSWIHVFDKFNLLKDLRLLFYCLTRIMFELAYYIPIDFLPEMLVKDLGFPQSIKGTILAVFGISSVVGRLASGMLAKLFPKHSIFISVLANVGMGSACIGVTFCSKRESFIGATVVYGLCTGCFYFYNVRILIDMYGVTDEFQDAYGFIMLASMFSNPWGPPIAGRLHDYFGLYNVAFYAAGIFSYIAALFNIIMLLIQNTKYRD